MGRELIDSRRIRVINYQTSDIHADISALNEALVDREARESLSLIDSIRSRLNILKDQIVNGDIVRNNN
jgi:hypothetical protein